MSSSPLQSHLAPWQRRRLALLALLVGLGHAYIWQAKAMQPPTPAAREPLPTAVVTLGQPVRAPELPPAAAAELPPVALTPDQARPAAAPVQPRTQPPRAPQTVASARPEPVAAPARKSADQIAPAPPHPPHQDTEVTTDSTAPSPSPALQVAALTAAVATAAAAPVTTAAVAPPRAPGRDDAEHLPPTRVPPSETLQYRVTKGVLSGSGQLQWQVEGGRYRLSLDARVPMFGTIFSQSSRGGFDRAGLAPERHTEKRLRRSEQALSFVREGGETKLAFSSRTETVPLQTGTQDRVSWMAQLPALLQGSPEPLRPGWQRRMHVADVQGEVQDWLFIVVEVPPAGQGGLVKLIREPEGRFETRAEVWVDPQRHYWPVRVRLSEGRSDPLELIAQPADDGS